MPRAYKIRAMKAIEWPGSELCGELLSGSVVVPWGTDWSGERGDMRGRLQNLGGVLQTSHKFSVPGGVLTDQLSHTAADWLGAGIFQPPFDSTYIEFDGLKSEADGSVHRAGCLLQIINEDGIDWAAFPFIRSHEMGCWVFTGFLIGVTNGYKDPTARQIPGVETLPEARYNAYIQLSNSIWNCCAASIVALSARGTSQRKVEEPRKLNKKREAKGRQPLYSYKVLKVEGVSPSGRFRKEGNVRSSPRLHWRRGHVRTLRSGAKVPVQAALVGDPALGFADKDYILSNIKGLP